MIALVDWTFQTRDDTLHPVGHRHAGCIQMIVVRSRRNSAASLPLRHSELKNQFIAPSYNGPVIEVFFFLISSSGDQSDPFMFLSRSDRTMLDGLHSEVAQVPKSAVVGIRDYG